MEKGLLSPLLLLCNAAPPASTVLVDAVDCCKYTSSRNNVTRRRHSPRRKPASDSLGSTFSSLVVPLYVTQSAQYRRCTSIHNGYRPVSAL
ncbi:hypothetical protein F4680DRAFT_359757 [Xylaria scruposa]|nr:hypothetical protein F4680DRAFT_359757 [Xylaria scruposa]